MRVFVVKINVYIDKMWAKIVKGFIRFGDAENMCAKRQH